MPLRLTRAVTIHKLQGDSIDKLIMTIGDRNMFGTTFTGFTRSRGGFPTIILAGNDDDLHLGDHLNANSGSNFDLPLIMQRLECMASASASKRRNGTLYNAHEGPIDNMVSSFTRCYGSFSCNRRELKLLGERRYGKCQIQATNYDS